MVEREKKMSKWKRERKRGRKERREGEEAKGYEVIDKEERNRQERDRKDMIRKTEYNRWYREKVTEEVSMYLRKAWSEERCKRIARFRLGKEMGEGKYWEAQEGRRCKVYAGEMLPWEHVMDRCVDGGEERRGLGERMRERLDLGGGGERWMVDLEEERAGL